MEGPAQLQDLRHQQDDLPQDAPHLLGDLLQDDQLPSHEQELQLKLLGGDSELDQQRVPLLLLQGIQRHIDVINRMEPTSLHLVTSHATGPLICSLCALLTPQRLEHPNLRQRLLTTGTLTRRRIDGSMAGSR